MDRTEHVHIVSAGKRIHIAYPAAFREFPAITQTIVFTDSIIHEHSLDPVTEKHRLAVRNALVAMQEISASLSIPVSREIIHPPAFGSVRSALAKIRRQYPDARYTFDLSGGSKDLCMALFAVAPWLGGEISSSFDEKAARRVPLPDRTIGSLLSNPNHQAILAILLNRKRMKEDKSQKTDPERPGDWVSRQYLYGQLFSSYAPSRTKKPEPGDLQETVITKKGRSPVAELSHATFSGFMRTLRDAGLVEEEYAPDSRKEKRYRITDAGETAFRFFSDPKTSSLVKSMLESS